MKSKIRKALTALSLVCLAVAIVGTVLAIAATGGMP